MTQDHNHEGVTGAVAHPVETTKDLAAEAAEGRSARTPAIALGGVTIVVGVAFALLLVVCSILWFALK